LPYFFAYYEAETLPDWPQAVYVWFVPWLPVAMILNTSLITFVLPWIVGLFGDQNNDHIA
jgi:hypothetical protein